MNNLESLLNLLGNLQSSSKESSAQEKIPKEVLDQYPYGDFPSRYTKLGQENLRKESENRFSYKEEFIANQPNTSNNGINFAELITLLQLFSGKKDSKDILKTLSKFLFKDNKELQTIIDLAPGKSIKSQTIETTNVFPNTNKIKISSLTRID